MARGVVAGVSRRFDRRGAFDSFSRGAAVGERTPPVRVNRPVCESGGWQGAADQHPVVGGGRRRGRGERPADTDGMGHGRIQKQGPLTRGP